MLHYNTATKKVSLIKEYDVVNRIFLLNGYLWICRLWNDIVCYDLNKHKECVISIGSIDNIDFSSPYITDMD